ncbi:adenosine deaminase [Staphylococcus ratti]|uniref:adenosine deaminase n=1 Tax=Staphylococcus ratti TaxID=2892440 RepID=A0ABY3PAE5_9STAP|nr:adenosine deaminase [Staphylococcus ratti]UEX89254.1 adenosine deaminase [Staphylococcus ratti]
MCDIEKIKAIPKVELHCHLDGSVSREYILRQSQKQGININFDKISVNHECESLVEYLKSFDEILKVMQTEDSLIEGVQDVAHQAENDGVKYIEIRFAPQFHAQGNMDIPMVLNAVSKGAELAEASYDITVRIIVCGMKHHSNEVNIEIFKHLIEDDLLQKYIVGVDLAGGEDENSIYNHEKALEYARNNKLNITLHAGECGCIKNVFDSVKMGAKRIGHGVALFNDDEKLLLFSEENVLLEICPTSNIQTKAIKQLHEINLNKLNELNIPYIINTDNRTVTNTNLIQEYRSLLTHNMITIEKIIEINKEALFFSFLKEDEKIRLEKRILNLLEQLEL